MIADNAKFCTNCGMPVRVLSDDLTDSVQPEISMTPTRTQTSDVTFDRAQSGFSEMTSDLAQPDFSGMTPEPAQPDFFGMPDGYVKPQPVVRPQMQPIPPVQPATSYYVQPAKKNSGVLAAVIIGVCILLVAGAVGVGITVKSIIDAADAVSGNKVTQAVSEDVLEAEAFGNTTGRTSIETAVEGYFKAKSIEEFADVVMSPSMLAYFCESLNVGEEDMKAVVGKNYDFKAYSYKNIRVVQKFQLSDSEIDDISEQYYSREMAAYIDELYEVIVQFDEGHNGDWNTYSSELYVYRSQGKWYVLVDW